MAAFKKIFVFVCLTVVAIVLSGCGKDNGV